MVLIVIIFIMTGCTEVDQDIISQSIGVWNTYFVYPLSLFIKYIAGLHRGNYGLGLIVMTVIVRLALLPLNPKQMKNSRAM